MVIWWRMLLVVARRADNLAKPPNAEVTTQDATRRGPWTPVIRAHRGRVRAAAAPRRTNDGTAPVSGCAYPYDRPTDRAPYRAHRRTPPAALRAEVRSVPPAYRRGVRTDPAR